MDTALTAIIGKYDCHFRVIKILEKVNIYCQKLKKGYSAQVVREPTMTIHCNLKIFLLFIKRNI